MIYNLRHPERPPAVGQAVLTLYVPLYSMPYNGIGTKSGEAIPLGEGSDKKSSTSFA